MLLYACCLAPSSGARPSGSARTKSHFAPYNYPTTERNGPPTPQEGAGLLFSECLNRADANGIAIASADTRVTYGEFRAAVAGFAAHLNMLGLTSGERVALWGYNSANWLIAFFGIVQAGGVAVLVNYSLGIDEAAELLRSSDCRFLVCGDNGQTKRRDDAMEALADAAGIVRNHCIDARLEATSLVATFARAQGLPEQRQATEATETAFIIFTSGTTSQPKAVTISQSALTADAAALSDGLEGEMGGSVCVAVPLFHILGLLTSYVYLIHGATVCLPADFRTDTLLKAIDETHASDMAAVGAIYQGLADAEGFARQAIPHLRLCLIAGGMSTPVQMMRLELAFTCATFINMYGQSEGAPLSMVRPSDMVEQRASTVGRAVKGVTLAIMGPEGAELPQGEVGEVCAKGACLMNGYEGLAPEDQAIDARGWLHTGDLGLLDENGYLHLAGRLKDVIIRGGENIAPAEIEGELTRIEGVRDAKVMGAPHPIYGESVEACVVMDADMPFTPEPITSALRKNLPRYKVPAHIFAFDAFPLNVNGKIDQRALYATMIGRLRRLQLDDELARGIDVFGVTVKNAQYAIEPVTAMAEHFADAVGFSAKRARKICLAVEEMLTERIMDAYSGAGDIRMRITLMPDWMRISFSDDGAEYVIDKRRDTSWSARIILGAVDGFHTEYHNGKPIYCMDFLYEDYVDIQSVLLQNNADVD